MLRSLVGSEMCIRDRTEKAAESFGRAQRHFRNAGIGARALGQDVKSLGKLALTTTGLVTGLGTAAAAALAPSEEVLAFDQQVQFSANLGGLQAPEIDALKDNIRGLSNTYGITANEIAAQHAQLTRSLGFEDGTATLQAAVEFQATTGIGVTDIEDELATAKISLGIDTAPETKDFLNLLGKAHQQGINVQNLDLGDMNRLRQDRDIKDETFQREFLTTIAFKQSDTCLLYTSPSPRDS